MNYAPRCLLSDPVHPHTLSFRDNPPPSECYKCGRDGDPFYDDGSYYYCDICKLVFHRYCITTLPGIRHPYHPNHFLNLTIPFSETETRSFDDGNIFIESIKKLERNVSYDFQSDAACDWCGDNLGKSFYHCRECGFNLDSSCSFKDPSFTITNPKSHQHPLTLFPRPLLVPCNGCGLVDKKDPGYVCLPCNYMVHLSCINLPRVIKLTRHPHRLSYTPFLPPPAKRSCGVCHRNLDVKYGMYSCNKGCSYAVHSKCATHKDIWDGIDLEGVPEEPFEDLSSFVEVGYNLIKHFSHEHDLKFDVDGVNHDECQACCRPIDSSGFYKCMSHCDFFLHASCADLIKKKEHPLHKHPLILQPLNNGSDCAACRRKFNGFRYECSIKNCDSGGLFKIDVGCSSICEPFEHKDHPHPLFISAHKSGVSLCGICGKRGHFYTLKFNDCEFIMCFTCATLPIVVHYKYDEHPLTLCVGEDYSGSYWCERCETEINPKKLFYTCNECCTTLHVQCLVGSFMSLMAGLNYHTPGYKFKIVSNVGNTRPFCFVCGDRCRDTTYFKEEDLIICSFKCF